MQYEPGQPGAFHAAAPCGLKGHGTSYRRGGLVLCLGPWADVARSHDHEEILDVEPGVAITIPVGTCFQFRSLSHEPLTAVGITMPPWPDESEAFAVEGIWDPTV